MQLETDLTFGAGKKRDAGMQLPRSLAPADTTLGTPFLDSDIKRQLKLNEPQPPGVMPNDFSTPENRRLAVQHMNQAITSAARKYAKNDDAYTMIRAKTLVSRALPRFDSSKSDIKTFIDRQLQPLMREQSRRSRRIRLPDRMQLDAVRLHEFAQEFENERGRPPSTQELASMSGISQSRIKKVRAADKSVYNASMELGDEDSLGSTMADAAVVDDESANAVWLKLVHHDLPAVDQFILESLTGMYGRELLPKKEIARRLKMSAPAVSQRVSRIQRLLDREDELNPYV